MKILGVSAFYHDSAASLIIDGKIIAACQEERLSRVKHDNSFPFKSIEYCLYEANLNWSDIDILCFYEDPILKAKRRTEFSPVNGDMNEELVNSLLCKDLIDEYFNSKSNAITHFVRHHLSHSASAFLLSPFSEALVLTVDGVGEYQTLTLSSWTRDRTPRLVKDLCFPNSKG